MTKRIGFATDSHSSITQAVGQEIGVCVLPMPFTIGGHCYYEGVTLSRPQFFELLDSGEDVATSQPAPDEVTSLWDDMLQTYDEVVYVPISSGLSGACATATALAAEAPYRNRVFVVDNGRVATPQHRSVLDAIELANQGLDGAQIKERLEKARGEMCIYVALQTLEHLKKGGRVSPTVAMVGTLLGIKPILHFTTGILESYKKTRGMSKARELMIEAVRTDLNGRFAQAYARGDVHLLTASSAPEEETAQWVAQVQAAFPDLPVMSDDLSMGVSCHIGYGGLGIGLSCRP